jgi:hypothetical protein
MELLAMLPVDIFHRPLVFFLYIYDVSYPSLHCYT